MKTLTFFPSKPTSSFVNIAATMFAIMFVSLIMLTNVPLTSSTNLAPNIFVLVLNGVLFWLCLAIFIRIVAVKVLWDDMTLDDQGKVKDVFNGRICLWSWDSRLRLAASIESFSQRIYHYQSYLGDIPTNGSVNLRLVCSVKTVIAGTPKSHQQWKAFAEELEEYCSLPGLIQHHSSLWAHQNWDEFSEFFADLGTNRQSTVMIKGRAIDLVTDFLSNVVFNNSGCVVENVEFKVV